MRVEVLLFGPLADAAGADRVAVDMPGGRTMASEVLAALATTAPGLCPQLSACRLAVNHAFAQDSTPIRETDEVALIGLVAGG